MEGVGSRLSRSSSRFGPATAVFNGPVRKWKKKWVNVSSSKVTHMNSQSQSNGSGKGNNNASRLLLRLWTPLSPTTTGDGENLAEEQPRRKFRYTPIAALEKLEKELAEKADEDMKTIEPYQSTARSVFISHDFYARPSMKNTQERQIPAEKADEDMKTIESYQSTARQQTEAWLPNRFHTSHLDLDLGLFMTDNGDGHESVRQEEEVQLGRDSSGGFWLMG